MSFLGEVRANIQSTSTLANPTKWLTEIFSNKTSSGQSVTEEKSMQNSAVYSCVRIIAETIASLPIHVYAEKEGGGKLKAKNNYLYPLLHNKPNNLMNSFTWRESLMAHLLLWGNHYSQLEIDNSGKIVGLWPLLPGRMQVKEKNRRLYYIYYPKNGSRTIYDSSEILHIPGLGFDGRVGKSVIKMAKEAVGLGLSAEEYGAKFFSQGAQPGGIIEYPGKFGDKAYERYKKDVQKKYSGLGNSHKIMVLEEDLKYHQTGIPPDDSQFLETRNFQKRDIAMIYRVPPNKLGDMEAGASYSSIEQNNIMFIIDTIRPWSVRLEQSLNDQLISSRNKKNFIKFNMEGLLRGDSEARVEFYKGMREVGAYSINEIREKEDDNPVEGGDMRVIPANMIPLSKLQDMEPNQTETNSKRNIETRDTTARRNLRDNYQGLIKNAAENIVNREVNKIQDLINKELKNEQTFRDEMVEFYNEQFPGEIKDNIRAVIYSFADEIAKQASAEIGLEDYDIEEFKQNYLEAFAQKYAGYSRGQLLALMNEALESEESATELVQQRLEEWQEKRADKVAMEQKVKEEGAITRHIYAVGGVTQLVWDNAGDACPLCKAMDGKTIDIQDVFMSPEDSLDVEGVDGIFSPGGIIKHPPLHSACDCAISFQI